VVVVDAQEDCAFFGERGAGADLRLQERFAEVDAYAITSPVERISGPRAGSTPGNLLNGKTGDLTNPAAL